MKLLESKVTIICLTAITITALITNHPEAILLWIAYFGLPTESIRYTNERQA
jgi:hypothetical protein